MRDHEARRGDGCTFREQNVEVDRAGAPTLATHAAQVTFDREELVEERVQVASPIDADRGVQEVGLGRTDGRGLVDGRRGAERREACDARRCITQVREAIADVGAEPDDGLQGVEPWKRSGLVKAPE